MAAATSTAATADIGLVGLAVMGENLVLNMERNGFTVAVYNRTTAKVDAFVGTGRGVGKKIVGCHTPEELVAALKRPRKVMLMVQAGKAVDATIAQLAPLLEPGDVIIDGGNSHFPDSNRRTAELEARGLLFVGSGVSGGEEGALNGPSIMPGGSEAAWPLVAPIFQKIAARADGTTEPCCDWVGSAGSGHFVKMVHNGIEYGDMQLICEAYHLLRSVLQFSNEQVAATFAEWNRGDLGSYLIEISAEIFRKRLDDADAASPYVVDVILDAAGQKGTGKWTATAALDFGVPVTLIGEAVFARCLSALKPARVHAAGILAGPSAADAAATAAKWSEAERKELVAAVADALFASKIVSYAQGFTLMRAAAAELKWKLNYGAIALMWRGGCIIRSQFLGRIKEAYEADADLENLLLAPFFRDALARAQAGWRKVAGLAIAAGVPIPAISTALCYYDGLRSAWLPHNLLQAQRDYFGAHTYKRIDKPLAEDFHTNWTGRGGSTHSSSYTV